MNRREQSRRYRKAARELTGRSGKNASKVGEMMMATADRLVALVALHEETVSGDLSLDGSTAMGREAQKAMDSLYAKIYNEIQTDVRTEWETANRLADEFVADTIGADILATENVQRYFSRRKEAMDAFLKRKTNGLNLSDKVWKYTEQFKSELELAMNVSIGEGLSAQRMSQRVRGYLIHPDKLFRRVRDKKSHLLKLSKAAKAYHPGRGVYRSAYKNAMRLARTETNMAYRTADCDRWQVFDFVLGYEVKTAGGDNVCKTCESLAGNYPKTFRFTGWHPHCRCFMIPITAQGDDWKKMKRAMVMGEKYESPNAIKDAPQFTKWAEEHEDAIEKAKKKGTLAYFLKDNKTFLEKAEENNHRKVRTPQEIEDIKTSWKERQEYNSFIKQMDGFNWTEDEKKIMAKYWQEVEKKQGWKKGLPMSVEEADEQKANPNYYKSEGYKINCQTCVPAYQLRTHGFDVFATPNTNGSYNEYLSRHWADIWKDMEGNDCKPVLFCDSLISGKKQTRYKNAFKYKRSFFYDFIKENTKEPGIYQISFRHAKGGHTTILERSKDGSLSHIEPQLYYDKSPRHPIEKLIKSMERCMQTNSAGLLRIDNKLIKEEYLSLFLPW